MIKLNESEIDLLIRLAEAARDSHPLDHKSMGKLYDLVDMAIMWDLIDGINRNEEDWQDGHPMDFGDR